MTNTPEATFIPLMTTALAGLHVVSQVQQRPRRRYKAPLNYNPMKWTMDQWDDERIRRFCRFQRHEIRRLLDCFQLENITFRYGYQPSPELALCLTLAKLSFPRTLYQLCFDFGLASSSISTIINDVLHYLAERYRSNLYWNPLLDSNRVSFFERRLRPKTGGLIWGFIDGTFKKMTRPGKDQRHHYSGYKKSHGFKYQALTTPDGLISHAFGPCDARANDLTMYRESAVDEPLKTVHDRQEQSFYIFGDQAYKGLPYVMSPYPGPPGSLTPAEKRFNDRLSKLRIAVENSFGLSHNLFMGTSWSYGFKLGSMQVGNYYLVAILLTNCFTCLRGNNISSKFKIDPPSLGEYMYAMNQRPVAS